MSSSHEAEINMVNQNPELTHVTGIAATAAVFGEPQNKPKANLYLHLGNAPRDLRTGLIEPTAEQRSEITRALSEFKGITPSSAYREGDVKQGVRRAQEMVEKGESSNFLSRLRMIESSQAAAQEIKPLRISMRGDIAIDPRRVVGVPGLRNWQGVSFNSDGTPTTKLEGGNKGVERPNYELIDDYATRDTQLPPVTKANIFLTRDGIFAITDESHRVAAAQLRNEPVRVEEIWLFDYRNQEGSTLVQLELARGLQVAERNSTIE